MYCVHFSPILSTGDGEAHFMDKSHLESWLRSVLIFCSACVSILCDSIAEGRAAISLGLDSQLLCLSACVGQGLLVASTT